MFDPRQIKTMPETLEKKSFQAPRDLAFTEFLITGGNADLGAFAAIQLYIKCMPIFNAVSMRAIAYSQLPMRVQDIKTKKFVEDHEILELLKKPNADVSQMEFLESVSTFYDITGDSFICATGQVGTPPLELITLSPQVITFGQGNNRWDLLNVPSNIWSTNTNQSQLMFNAEEDEGGIRFITSTKDKELWHLRTNNPLRSTSNFRGLSPARAIWTEAEQYISGNITQLSMLKRGSRLSMAWVNARKEALTDEQWSRMQEQSQKFAGDKNAGGIPVLDGMDVKTLQQTNKDMEFNVLQTQMLSRISTIYKIPLSLLSTETMTLNNLETGELQFYDNAVLPLADRLNDELTRFLMPRYKNSENLRLTYNENDVTALRTRSVQTAKDLSEIKVSTINEIRRILGDEDRPEGDVLLIPTGVIPLGTDTFDDSIDALDEDTKKHVSSKFRQMLREKGLSEEQITLTAENSGL